jgi:cell division protein FtsW (lipid II flippase)
MLLAFVILWAYVAFSQFLIIWSGDLPDEISWYVHRVRGGWQWIAACLIVGHFALPFLLLLSRDIKQRVRYLALLAAALLVMRFIDMVWNVDPAFDTAGFRFHWLDVMAAIGVGGVWIAGFLARLKRRPLLPLHDPDLPGVIAAAEGAR